MRLLDTTKIRRLREQRGWEQKELAAHAKINPAVVSRLERGLQNDFKLSVIVAVASSLGVTVDNLLTQDHQVSPSQITPELQSAINHLSNHSSKTQSRLASMIEAYLKALESEE